MAVPNDPVNLQRALWILRDLGLVEIRDSKPVDVTELDVIKNPGGIKIVPLEAAQAPRALDDVDFAAIQGNFAIYSGLKLTNAFALEKMTIPYINVVAVKQATRRVHGRRTSSPATSRKPSKRRSAATASMTASPCPTI